jgi:hypothetical protein
MDGSKTEASEERLERITQLRELLAETQDVKALQPTSQRQKQKPANQAPAKERKEKKPANAGGIIAWCLMSLGICFLFLFPDMIEVGGSILVVGIILLIGSGKKSNSGNKSKIDANIVTLTKRYERAQRKNELGLVNVEGDLKRKGDLFQSIHSVTPKQRLEKIEVYLDTPRERKGISGFFAGVIDGALGNSREYAEKQYQAMLSIYHYFDAECNVAFAKVAIANARYNFVCRKAVLYVQQIKELIENFTDKQKKQFDKAGEMELEQIGLNGLQSQQLFESIQSFNNEYAISTKAMWEDTIDFSVGMVGKGKHGTAIGLGAVAITGIVNVVGNISRNNEIEAQLIEGMTEIRDALPKIKANKLKAEAFVKRADEISNYLEDSMKRYTVMFQGIYAQLFPTGDNSKTKNSRKQREKSGGDYYTPEELQIIMPLCKYAKQLKLVTEADF